MSLIKRNLRKFESTEEELQLYKRLIADLPIDIDYIDAKTNIRISKKKNDRTFDIKEVNEKGAKKSKFVYPSIEYKFEQLEKFLQPMLDVVPHQEQNDIIFQFKDNGIGIENKNLKYIFDPFFSTKETGTGLGLSLSKKIIELHGGTLSVNSAPHKGTIFTIKIPIYNVKKM